MTLNVLWPVILTAAANMLFANLATADPAETSAAEAAKKLSNPLAAMISVPFQMNYDQDMGEDDTGDRYLMNLQPVMPISLSEDWNLISRTIVPIVSQDDIVAGSGSQTGLGDITESLWFSPAQPTENGLVWGVGTVILLPTATDDLFWVVRNGDSARLL